ncbi:hypothetical protein Tco_0052163 [Tanacetum coccineum]
MEQDGESRSTASTRNATAPVLSIPSAVTYPQDSQRKRPLDGNAFLAFFPFARWKIPAILGPDIIYMHRTMEDLELFHFKYFLSHRGSRLRRFLIDTTGMLWEKYMDPHMVGSFFDQQLPKGSPQDFKMIKSDQLKRKSNETIRLHKIFLDSCCSIDSAIKEVVRYSALSDNKVGAQIASRRSIDIPHSTEHQDNGYSHTKLQFSNATRLWFLPLQFYGAIFANRLVL